MRLRPLLHLVALAAARGAEADEKYLVPLLIWGPNNQFGGLLEALVIAARTGRTLLLPKYFARWFRDGQSPGLVPFEDVFEAAPLANVARVAVVDHAVQELWARKRQWSVLASPLPRSDREKALALLDLDGDLAIKKPLPKRLRLDDFAQRFQDFSGATFVALAPLFTLAGETKSLRAAARHRVRAPEVRRRAEAVRRALFGPSPRRLLAVHVRRESEELGCAHGRRYVVCPREEATVPTEDVLAAIVAAAKRVGAHDVYLAHAGQGAPWAAGEPEKLLADLNAKGLRARTASDAVAMAGLLNDFSRPTPFTVSLVEQEICATAFAFQASELSTWSATVTLDRAARGHENVPALDSATWQVGAPVPGKLR
mmetsp:Transcript_9937/g.29706  ORF Transcript_9937/g.29706 Transcript_9937/m.29706 type:complete len:370 (+) Transcript_9937:297-1406(+)